MIVQGTQRKVIDIEIDPVGVIDDLEECWKTMCRVPLDAELLSGYWTREETRDRPIETIRLRLATPLEIEQQKAFETIREIANDCN